MTLLFESDSPISESIGFYIFGNCAMARTMEKVCLARVEQALEFLTDAY